MKFSSSERGAALLTVLMLVAVIAVIAAVSLERLKLATRASINVIAIDQARNYGYAAEAVALSRIADLVGRDQLKTTLATDWNGRRVPFPIDGGTASALISDGGNCFNVNSIVSQNVATGSLAARPVAALQFQSLIVNLGVREADARVIVAALSDWIDSDNIAGRGGSEDDAYARGPTSYLPGNTMMGDPSEIRVIAGMTAPLYSALRPWICALPSDQLSPININTLSPAQAPLVAMMIPGQLTVQAAKAMIDARPPSGFDSTASFWSLPALGGLIAPAEVVAQTGLKTRWFALDFTVALGGAEFRETALIDAGTTPARLVRRTYGDPV